MSIMTVQAVPVPFSTPRGKDFSDSVFHLQSASRKSSNFQGKPRGRVQSTSESRPRQPRVQAFTPSYTRRPGQKEAPAKQTPANTSARVQPSPPHTRKQRNASHSGSRRPPPPSTQTVPQDVTMSDAREIENKTTAPSTPPSHPLTDVINHPNHPVQSNLSTACQPPDENTENRAPTPFERPFERSVLQPVGSACPPGLSPPIHKPLPTATWHRMGISTSEYMFLLKKVNPHTTHVMSQFNPDRRFLHPAFLEPPATYGLHKVPTYKRTMVKWDQHGHKWEASGKHQRSGDWFCLDKTWVTCSQREQLCTQWRNSRCETCTSSPRSLHNRVLVHAAALREEERFERRCNSEEVVEKMDPLFCQDSEMHSPPSSSPPTSLADELTTTESSTAITTATEDDNTTPTLQASVDDLVCPPTPRPQSFDDFDEDEDSGDLF